MQTLSIVIVSYNDGPVTERLLRSLVTYNLSVPFEVVIVENGTPQRAVSFTPSSVRTVQNLHNLGLSRALNQGIAAAKGDTILVLNPDTEITAGAVDRLLMTMEERLHVGIVAPRLVYPDGKAQPSCRRFYSVSSALGRRLPLCLSWRRAAQQHIIADLSGNQPCEVDWVIGAAMLFRRTTWQQIGGFDESFFLYFEDVDFCKRVWLAGMRVVYEPRAVVVHEYRQASRRCSGLSTAGLRHAVSGLRYAAKWGRA